MTNTFFPLATEPYLVSLSQWPQTGKVILAQYDNEGVWVYQAYKPSIADYAVKFKKFVECRDFSLNRMSWVKTNFLWMQFRSGWCSKTDQEKCIALKLKREFFDEIIASSVDSREISEVAIKTSNVRLQWDPDHDPKGDKCERRAIQLGLRGDALYKMACGEVVLDIIDVTEFIVNQRNIALDSSRWAELTVPIERPYQP